ncbi:MAG: L-threonylcarbamoyladenylate synthase [Bermanella sp.]
MRWPIYQASQILHHNGVIAYPTETVWGLGCNPQQTEGLQRLLALKKRDAQKGLILIAAHIEQFDFLLKQLPPKKIDLLKASWPGPVTWLVPHHGLVHPLVHGRFATVAIRVSTSKLVQDLCREFGGPIVSTSANEAGQVTVQNAIQAHKFLGPQLDFILSGPLGNAQSPSRIIDLQSGRIIRG